MVRVEEESDEGDWEEVKGGASAPMVGTLIHCSIFYFFLKSI